MILSSARRRIISPAVFTLHVSLLCNTHLLITAAVCLSAQRSVIMCQT